jgi:hypothetical protein
VCGINAKCQVINHLPTCTCLPGYRGDPFSACSLIPPRKYLNTNIKPCLVWI